MTAAELPNDLAAELAADDDETLRAAVGAVFELLESRPYASRRVHADDIARRLFELPLRPDAERVHGSDAGTDGGDS